MEIVISSPILENYPLAKLVIKELTNRESELNIEGATLYFGFPRFHGYEDGYNDPDLLLLSKNHGVIVFRFKQNYSTINVQLIEEEVDDLFSLIFSRLLESKSLRLKRNKLSVPLEVFCYSDSSLGQVNEELECRSIDDINSKLNDMMGSFDGPLSDEIVNEVRSILEGTKAFSHSETRSLAEGDQSSKAYILSELENEIKNFDYEQRTSAVTIIQGPQRIRGLAGSGKTVVLAMKAAQIHMTEPNKKILFTFYTKSLYSQVKNLITKFYRHYKKVDPDWKMLQIKHAWGGAGVDGVYYTACTDNGISPMMFKQAKSHSPDDPFGYICGAAIETNKVSELYDYILIDEAQDMPVNFFRLVYLLTKGVRDKKNIVWGYDELQNIFRVRTRSPKELFGADGEGVDLIDLDRSGSSLPPYLSNDIVLHKCYRNPRSVLICAHSLGFGLCNLEEALPVQMLEDAEHWTDLGYEVVSGNFTIGSEVVVQRPAKNSPLAISNYEEETGLIEYFVAGNYEREVKWIVKSILQFVKEGLKPEDILVIALDDFNARNYFESITEGLETKGIGTNNILLNPYNSLSFTVEGKVTLSTVHRAKGNEAAAVLVIGIDALYRNRRSRFARNRIFTAFTRSKAWLRVSGIGEHAAYYCNEIDRAMADYPNMKFIQPNLQQVETIQRDISQRSTKIKRLQKEYAEQLELLGASEEEEERFFDKKK